MIRKYLPDGFGVAGVDVDVAEGFICRSKDGHVLVTVEHADEVISEGFDEGGQSG